MGPPTLQSTTKPPVKGGGSNEKGHLVFFRNPNFNTIISGHIFVMKCSNYQIFLGKICNINEKLWHLKNVRNFARNLSGTLNPRIPYFRNSNYLYHTRYFQVIACLALLNRIFKRNSRVCLKRNILAAPFVMNFYKRVV